MSTFIQIIERATQLKAAHAERDNMFCAMRDLYLLKWSDEQKVKKLYDNVKITISPDIRNMLLGGIRLLTSQEPAISVPVDKNDTKLGQVSSKVEKFLAALWQIGGRTRGAPLHYDVVRSAMIFGEIHIAIISTQDLLEYAKGGGPAALRRAELLAAKAPYIFEVYDPTTGYPEFDEIGMSAYYREYETVAGTMIDRYGEMQGKTRYEMVTVCEWWDLERHIVWIKDSKEPLVDIAHGLPFIPIVVQLVEGSKMFVEEEDRRQPFLYTAWKSGLWDRQNLMLTVMFTQVFALGANPMFIFQQGQTGEELELDFSQPGGVVNVPPGASFGPLLNKGVIDPSMMAAWDLARVKLEESTIYGQTLGQPITGQGTFSTTALLHQAGRLPLSVPQKISGWAIGDALRIAIEWMRHIGDKRYQVRLGSDVMSLDMVELPDQVEVEVNLDIALPQDRLQAAQVANALTQGEFPLVSQEWALSEVLGVGQPDVMRRQVWGERAAWVMYNNYLQDLMMKAKQKAEAEAQAAMMQGAPGQQPPGMAMQGGGMPQGEISPPESPVVDRNAGGGGMVQRMQPQQPIPSPGMPGDGAAGEGPLPGAGRAE